jgi:hypothetical protein
MWIGVLVLVVLRLGRSRGGPENRNPEVEGYSYVNLVLPKNVGAQVVATVQTRRVSRTFAATQGPGSVRAGSWAVPGR